MEISPSSHKKNIPIIVSDEDINHVFMKFAEKPPSKFNCL